MGYCNLPEFLKQKCQVPDDSDPEHSGLFYSIEVRIVQGYFLKCPSP